jgi:hypothetical protein
MADKTTLADQQQGTPKRFKDAGDGTFAELVVAVPAPLPFATLGHYRVTHRTVLVATQAANSRLFSVRNNGANLLVATRLIIKWLATGAHTAAIEDSLDVFKCTAFSVSDSVNVVTPAADRKRTSMAAAPGGAEIRGLTAAGAAAGMTGGTLTKDPAAFGQLPQWFQAVLPTQQVLDVRLDAEDDVNGTHPFVLAPSEGIEIENRQLLGAAASSSVYIDFSYAEVVTF